jgi:hypothetical protein
VTVRIVLTGDMAVTGKQDDLDEAHGFIDDAPAPGSYLTAHPDNKPTIAFAKSLVELLPGNNDRYLSKRWFYRPGGTKFDLEDGFLPS